MSITDFTKFKLRNLLNPLELLRTQKVLKINPNAIAERQEVEHLNIYAYHFNAETIKNYSALTIHECKNIDEENFVTWINIDGIKKNEIEEICEKLNIHPLITEDILSIGQRPKMDEIENHFFCLLNMLYFNQSQSAVETEQISIILGKNYVISFQEDNTRDVFNSVREKLKNAHTKIRQNKADFLFYILIDTIVDHYYFVMEQLSEKIENLEDTIVKGANLRSMAKINILRKEMIVLKRNIVPVKEMVYNILRSETDLIDIKTEKYFKDVHDHVMQANDFAENYRDMLLNLQDLYLNQVNLKTNEVMKVMAIVTCLLAPATVIGGIFGMNFETIPFKSEHAAFITVVCIMLVIPIIMLIIFKRKGWY